MGLIPFNDFAGLGQEWIPRPGSWQHSAITGDWSGSYNPSLLTQAEISRDRERRLAIANLMRETGAPLQQIEQYVWRSEKGPARRSVRSETPLIYPAGQRAHERFPGLSTTPESERRQAFNNKLKDHSTWSPLETAAEAARLQQEEMAKRGVVTTKERWADWRYETATREREQQVAASRAAASRTQTQAADYKFNAMVRTSSSYQQMSDTEKVAWLKRYQPSFGSSQAFQNELSRLQNTTTARAQADAKRRHDYSVRPYTPEAPHGDPVVNSRAQHQVQQWQQGLVAKTGFSPTDYGPRDRIQHRPPQRVPRQPVVDPGGMTRVLGVPSQTKVKPKYYKATEDTRPQVARQATQARSGVPARGTGISVQSQARGGWF